MSGVNIPIPVCAVCNRLVDDLNCREGDGGMEYIFEAKCHGETEVTRVDAATFIYRWKLEAGVAFATGKIK